MLLRSLSVILIAICAATGVARAADPMRGTAITDGLTLRALDLRDYADVPRSLSLASLLGTNEKASASDIFALASMKPLREALEREFRDYKLNDLQPFERDALFANTTRFILAGVLNRMDRAYKTPDTCGEIRLIYRPIANFGAGEKSARLPMTLNLIFNAKGAAASCAELARRWTQVENEKAFSIEAAQKLSAKGGALEFLAADQIDRIETNIQISRASVNPEDFSARADYLMKVFKFDAASKSFIEGPMENQIDTQKILGDAALKANFTSWLLAPDNLAALDRGMIVIPDRFLATRAIAVTPSSDSNVQGLFTESDIVEALSKASAQFENIKSPAGFERRLNDSTCAGCHQTRAIGGFHFSGVDWSGDKAGMVVAPASPHFFGDQPRRRDILASTAGNASPDFSRGFAARPQALRSGELLGATYLNGWGASCYPPGADASFASWTCAEGLSCQQQSGKPGSAGLCFPKIN